MLGYFILGIAILLALIVGRSAIANAKPGVILQSIRIALLIIFGSLAAFFALTGRFQYASGFTIAALFFLRSKPLFSSRSADSGQTTGVNTEWLDANLDHDSGEMNAKILKGDFNGKLLSELSLPELQVLLEELSRDHQSASLLQAYILRYYPDVDHNYSQNSDNGTDGQTSANYSQSMSVTEAYEVLDLKPGATEDDIKTAHRKLMKKFHPDHDGSAYMAAKINQAKDILIKVS
jgi:DnaJ domain